MLQLDRTFRREETNHLSLRERVPNRAQSMIRHHCAYRVIDFLKFVRSDRPDEADRQLAYRLKVLAYPRYTIHIVAALRVQITGPNQIKKLGTGFT